MNIGNPSPIAREYMERGQSESCPIVDLHGHIGPFGAAYLPAASMDKMLKSMERAGVKRLVVSATDALFTDTAYGNKLTQATIDKYPERFLGYWTLNPNYPDIMAGAIRDFQRSRGFVGFKLYPDYHGYPLTGEKYAPVLEYASERGLLALVHTWGGSECNSARHVADVAGKYPGAAFIMGHSGFGDWDAAVGVGRDFPNAYLDLATVYVAHDFGNLPPGNPVGTSVSFMESLQLNGIIEFMVEKASSKKILYATDLPWYSPHYAAGAVLFARIDDDARHDILHRNAERLLSKSPEYDNNQSKDKQNSR